MLEKINLGYSSVYARDRILNFKKGRLINETFIGNTKSES